MGDNSVILLVDDEPSFLEMLSMQLGFSGFDIMLTGSGEEAFEKLKEGGIDVVLSDIRMPNGDGLELLDKVKELNGNGLSFVTNNIYLW